jgi:hypothetical protein
MDALWDKCGQLGMPINIHVSDPIWSYQPMDRTNDGLMNGYTWMILAEALRNCALYADLVVKPSNSREPQPQHLAPAHSTKGAQVGDRVANAPDLLRGVNQRPCLLRCWWDNLAGLKRR